MVGGTDEIYADVKNRPGIAFIPEAKFWWAMNGAPRTVDRSGATINRLRVVLFNRTIPQNERISGLEGLLAKEKPGIFNHLMYAYRRLCAAGKFTLPEASEQWIQQYRAENDTEFTFLREEAEYHDSYSTQSQTLYDGYKRWCEANGFRPKNRNQIVQEWRRLGLKDRTLKGRTVWDGVKLRT
jgi:putative DNA primase/helicase